MTFEQWLKRPVYVAQCKVWKIISTLADQGEWTWEQAHRVHMLKVPLSAPHLPEWDAATIADHCAKVKQSRDRAAKVIRSVRRYNRWNFLDKQSTGHASPLHEVLPFPRI